MRVIPVKQDWKPPIKLIKVKDGIHSIWDWTPLRMAHIDCDICQLFLAKALQIIRFLSKVLHTNLFRPTHAFSLDSGPS